MSEEGERLSDSDSSQLLALGENGESDAESEVSDDLRLQTYGSDFGTAGRKQRTGVSNDEWAAKADAAAAAALETDEGGDDSDAGGDRESGGSSAGGESESEGSSSGSHEAQIPRSALAKAGDSAGGSAGGKRSIRRYFEEEDSSVTCRHCGGIGHYARDCVNEKMPKPCFLCGEKGHTARDCMNQQCFRCRRGGHKSSQCPNRPYPEGTCYRCGRAAGHSPYECPHAVRFDGLIDLPPPLAPDPLLSLAWSGVRGNKDYWNVVDALRRQSKAPPRDGVGAGDRDAQTQGTTRRAAKTVDKRDKKRKRSLGDMQPGDLDDDDVEEVEVSSDENVTQGSGTDRRAEIRARGKKMGLRDYQTTTPQMERPSKKAKQTGARQKELEDDGEEFGALHGGGKKKKKKKNRAPLADADAFHRDFISLASNPDNNDAAYLGRRARQKMRRQLVDSGGGNSGGGQNGKYAFTSPHGKGGGWQVSPVAFKGSSVRGRNGLRGGRGSGQLPPAPKRSQNQGLPGRGQRGGLSVTLKRGEAKNSKAHRGGKHLQYGKQRWAHRSSWAKR